VGYVPCIASLNDDPPSGGFFVVQCFRCKFACEIAPGVFPYPSEEDAP